MERRMGYLPTMGASMCGEDMSCQCFFHNCDVSACGHNCFDCFDCSESIQCITANCPTGHLQCFMDHCGQTLGASEETGVGDVDASSVPSSGPAVADADDVDGHGHVDDEEEEDDDKEEI